MLNRPEGGAVWCPPFPGTRGDTHSSKFTPAIIAVTAARTTAAAVAHPTRPRLSRKAARRRLFSRKNDSQVSMAVRPPVRSDSAGANLTFVEHVSSYGVLAGARLAGSARFKLDWRSLAPWGRPVFCNSSLRAGRPLSLQPTFTDHDPKNAQQIIVLLSAFPFVADIEDQRSR